MSFVKFTSIESFSSVWKHAQRQMRIPVVQYVVRQKLHGTHGAIRMERDGKLFAQKRSCDLNWPHDDNAGFGAWVFRQEVKEAWENVFNSIDFDDYAVIYGEWAGPGIQKSDAVSKIQQKSFFVFAIEIDGLVYNEVSFMEKVIFENDNVYFDNVFVIPDFCDVQKVDFLNLSATQTLLDVLNEEVDKIGEEDPYIKELFDVSGPGEGLVLAPVADGMKRNEWAGHVFKMKTKAHGVKKTSKAATISAEIPDNIIAFVETFVTDARCEQGVQELGGDIDIKNTADFIRWMHADVRKESTIELEEMGIKYDAVAKVVAKAASIWYQKKSREIF